MLLKVVDGNEFRDIPISEGSLFLLPRTPVDHFPLSLCLTFGVLVALGNTPHNPVRFPDTVGVVIECTRHQGSKGRFDPESPVGFPLTGFV
jgi:3-hydroxyanthranilate 3,4-dioxygenase